MSEEMNKWIQMSEWMNKQILCHVVYMIQTACPTHDIQML